MLGVFYSGVRQIGGIKLIRKKFTDQLDPQKALFFEMVKFNFVFNLLLYLYCHFVFELFICVE